MKQIINELKVGFQLAKRNVVSYFLAILGLIILLGIIMTIIMVPIILAVWSVSPGIWMKLAQGIAMWTVTNPGSAVVLMTIVMIPISSLFFAFLGALYGMSRELVQKGETHAEFAFSWLRHKFPTLFGAGVILTCIVVIPQVLLWSSVTLLTGQVVQGFTASALSIFSFVWSFFTLGVTSMVFPAVVYGKNVQDAFKISFELAKQRFDRIFGIWSAIVVLLLVSFVPPRLILQLLGTIPTSFGTLAIMSLLGVLNFVIVLLWALLLFPMTIITFTRMYAEMTGGEIAANQFPSIPFL